MSDFFNPKKITPEDPYTCRCLPIKYVVATIQIAAIILSAVAFLTPRMEPLLCGFWMLFFFFMTGSFTFYVYEQKEAMALHFFCSLLTLIGMLIFLVVPIGFKFLVELSQYFVGGNHSFPGLAMGFFLSILFVFCGLFYYTWMCHQLVTAVDRKNRLKIMKMKMQNLFNPANIDPEDPYTCRCLPVKYVVAMIQLIVIVISVGSMIGSPQQLFLQGVFTLGMILSFAGYSFEQKHLMLVHFYFAGLVMILIIAYSGIVLLNSLFGNGSSNRENDNFLYVPFIFIGLLYYMAMCHQLLKAVARKTASTQILFF